MTVSGQAVAVDTPSARPSPLVFWHLLSLDAPAVAALWTWFAARANGIRLTRPLPLTMFLAVWCLYAGDRLLDASRRQQVRGGLSVAGILEARHHFHHVHRRWFVAAILGASLTMVSLLAAMPQHLLLVYLPLGLATAAWLAVVHWTDLNNLPKELATGLIFAAAVFLPTLAQGTRARLDLLVPALLFAGLLSLNGLFIFRWEHSGESHPDPLCQQILDRIRFMALALALLSVLCVSAVSLAIGLASVGLLLVDQIRGRLDRLTLRIVADLLLLTPLLLLPALR